MTNTMPMLTDEQREELIQYAAEEVRLKTEHITRLEKHMPGQFDTSRYQMELLTAQIALAALKPHPDELRMDYLVSKSVNVREPLLYGSHSLFWSHELTDEEDDHYASRLREQIDEAISSESKTLNGVTK